MTNKVIKLDPNATMQPQAIDPNMFIGKAPTQHDHQFFAEDKIGLYVGLWDTTAVEDIAIPYPCDELIVTLEGEFDMVCADKTATVCRAGDSVTFRSQAPVAWKQEAEYLKKFYVIYDNPNTPKSQNIPVKGAIDIIDLRPDVASLPIMDNTAPFEIKGPAPQQRNLTTYTNDNGDFFAGIWHSAPMRSEMRPFPTHEFVRMLSGSVTITEENGTAQTFNAGDCFFVPKGTVCTWEITDHVTKHYAIIDA